MSHTTTSLSQNTLDNFKSLRFRKAKTNACLYLKIDQEKLMVDVEDFKDSTTVEEIAEELPTSSPRFLIISYELKHKDGRISYPLVGIYYCPVGASTNARMLYASSTNMVFEQAQITGKTFDLIDPEEFTKEWLEEKILSVLTRK